MIRGLWNYAIKVADLETATCFYVDTLNAQVRIRSQVLGCDYRLIRIGDTRVILFEKAPYEESLGIELPLGFLHDVYEVDDFDAHLTTLRASGVRILMEPCDIEGAFGRRRIVFFETADGMRTELMQILHDTGRA